ncbi:hypothetical protein AQ837_24495 [Burkholderia pseudomallei]|nr:hypothetical protein AQ730_00510 [Burkholderia pseudomallei]OMS89878.1 hypothetical protein AQ748_04495 [Burkholderia pseudomallei]OMU99874.1 hypothetical protein AQ784_05320 [Burkholderia pseudomallei]OMV08079.1 hypothetical protein AQ785_26680 [Burkholderia pseudomallei]OMW55961.1 hypothetical protein AQ812_16210 [Burkholderia pseudomallei]
MVLCSTMRCLCFFTLGCSHRFNTCNSGGYVDLFIGILAEHISKPFKFLVDRLIIWFTALSC